MRDYILKYAFAIFASVVVSFLVFRIDFLQHFELFFYNLRFELKAHNFKNNDIVLITYNSDTLKKYHNFIPYSIYAQVIKKLELAKVIGLDIHFNQFTSPNDMNIFISSIRENNKVILASHFSGGFFDSSQNYIKYMPPINDFSRYSEYGYNNYIPDIDGFLRRTASYYKFNQQNIIEESFCYQVIKKAGLKINNNDGIYLLNFFSKSGSFEEHSIEDLIEGRINNQFKNKIIIVGSENDIFKIPFLFKNKMNRLEIHANNILTLITGNKVKKVNLFINGFILALSCFFGVLIANYFSRKKSTIIIPLTILIYTIINFYFFIFLNIYFNLTFPILGLILSFLVVKYYIYDYRNREIIAVRNIFKPYLAPQMLDEVIKKKDYLDVLKGERRVVTVIFADIADFTVLSERLPTDEVVKILNQLLTQMTEVIFENKGTLDKYTGDGVMAVFGNIGKLDIKENSFRAVKTSIEMREKLEILQKTWISQGIMPLQIRIGICTGEAIVGNIGSPEHMDLTVIGDTVNTASRLEALNKNLNTNTLINRNTYEYVKDVIRVKSLGFISLKGKDEKVEVFEVLGWKK